jgi:hypothetical protein
MSRSWGAGGLRKSPILRGNRQHQVRDSESNTHYWLAFLTFNTPAGQETPPRTLSDNLPAVQANEAQYVQSPATTPTTRLQSQPLGATVAANSEDSSTSDYADQSYTWTG